MVFIFEMVVLENLILYVTNHT